MRVRVYVLIKYTICVTIVHEEREKTLFTEIKGKGEESTHTLRN